jgi:hypothetical protein
MSRCRPVHLDWRFRTTSRQTANELHGDPRLPTAEKTHRQRSAATGGACFQSALEAVQIHLPAQCRRPVIIVLREQQPPPCSILVKLHRRETQMIHTPRVSGRHRKVLIHGSFSRERQSQVLHLARRRLACIGPWARNGNRTKALSIVGTVRWPI